MTNKTTAHVGINGQLLGGTQSYRSAGVSGTIRQLLLHLGDVAPDLHLTAFVPDVPLEVAGSLTLRRSRRWNAQRPVGRILWEQTALPVLTQILHLDLLHGAVNIGPWLAGCPTVITVHDLSFMQYPQAFPALQRLYLQTQVKRSVRAARRVITVSEATKRDVVAQFGVPAERIDVVYNGVDRCFGPAPADQVDAFRRRKGLPDRYVLHLGTLEPRKNLVRLVQAFHQARARGFPDVKLILAGGKGWGYDVIFAEVGRLGLEKAVLFPGYIPDEELPWWYRGAELFCYPSLLEGFGLPVVEALASGLPVITSTSSSLPEVAGEAAWLVDPSSVDALALALTTLLTDRTLADSFRSKGPAQAARFSWHSTAEHTAAVYRKALAESTRGGVA